MVNIQSLIHPYVFSQMSKDVEIGLCMGFGSVPWLNSAIPTSQGRDILLVLTHTLV